MGRFLPLYCRRSDGRLEVIGKGRRKERNEPAPEQLDMTPNKQGVSDYYREVTPDDAKSLDWRRKLGGMLARELDWKDKPGGYSGYMLVAFPENYRLYEHIKKTERDGKTEIKSKTHAGGGNDRQDAYLYGHPAGRRKRFRSPGDFFPHLLWLVTDEEGDPDNCGCKICSPEDLENIVPGAKVKVEKSIKQEIESKPAPAQTAAPSQMPAPKQESNNTVARPRNTSQALTPTVLPKPRHPDQDRDRLYRSFMYRPGELVWFQRGSAWALGIIIRRWLELDQYVYAVRPLSYPGAEPAVVTKSSESGFRPWLAWSVPKFTHSGLNTLPQPFHYDTADWQGLMQKRYGDGELEVDASILAAKAIDATYTPIEPARTVEVEPGVTETYYDGLFLGAEKVWCGDPLRLTIGSGTDIVVVHSISERKHVSGPYTPPLSLTGDVYTLSSAPYRQGDRNPNIPTPENTDIPFAHLPLRLVEDLRKRNGRSIALRNTASYWKLVAPQSKVALDQIKGRWYEATLLLPILDQNRFDEMTRKGDISESSLWLNSRLDCQNTHAPQTSNRHKQSVRKETRKEAIGKAVPPYTEIQDGVEPPVANNGDAALDRQAGDSSGTMEIDARFSTADDGGGGEPGQDDTAGAELDDLMNLDAGEMAGFGQDYITSQTTQRSGYF
ncbi:hypothetical protein BAUCODRAFT_79611 [Baudoinia panamericana UAMH 10762]|uniref:Cryptic loci regulator 2 N-terminal domain-containing protein n=1 Tax=Baudoinia panamericana (strain UAMH 10762) TaxID=717646 RepID=M2MYH1_BAUPA|nr:uncharacterized protein BAUCODRAFT_79611 [Baudoinia panamericana UAMH 10762]EMC91704.1 hypothetical protein BAUCODRAFT_79611 [Baudoinia panamericana UAMH 10762]